MLVRAKGSLVEGFHDGEELRGIMEIGIEARVLRRDGGFIVRCRDAVDAKVVEGVIGVDAVVGIAGEGGRRIGWRIDAHGLALAFGQAAHEENKVTGTVQSAKDTALQKIPGAK